MVSYSCLDVETYGSLGCRAVRVKGYGFSYKCLNPMPSTYTELRIQSMEFRAYAVRLAASDDVCRSLAVVPKP